MSRSWTPFIGKSGRYDQAAGEWWIDKAMVERNFQHLNFRFGQTAEETPIINELRQATEGAVRVRSQIFPIEPSRQQRFYMSKLKLEIEVLTGSDRSALASEVV